MIRPRFTFRRVFALLLAALLTGCGTTKMTDSPRAATEMLLVSQAIDYAVAKMDFSALSGQAVFLDTTPIEKDVIDKGYVISLVRQQLLAHGALIQEERTRALYVVELRAGAIGTDRHSVMVGTPAVSLPSVVPGLPTSIPEIALMKKNDQRGVAKIGVFAYNRVTGRALWQSGTVEGESQSKDLWVFGAGPFSKGTIRDRTELAGEPLPSIPTPAELLGTKSDKDKHVIPAAGTAREQFFPNNTAPAPPLPVPAAAEAVTGSAILANTPLVR
ncbi:hypothetical protein GobsT_42120 [Gemmata obscuriglobus]|nr:hypothetical protein GobsT_42120 [Gemmata obscuriglobus]VTS08506.1 Uncharacterized protein OS=Singulisphaera acidiphila (strain ATCC BAA-1392 / DSM 18658 / VKM B-2454 / MOB10) GN=Sinac_6447 PE=4 SV=1 [Gemmata obscuriglobus UQM 2246]